MFKSFCQQILPDCLKISKILFVLNSTLTELIAFTMKAAVI